MHMLSLCMNQIIYIATEKDGAKLNLHKAASGQKVCRRPCKYSRSLWVSNGLSDIPDGGICPSLRVVDSEPDLRLWMDDGVYWLELQEKVSDCLTKYTYAV